MHIEKNVCDSVLGTLLNINGKTKDTYKARLDLEYMGIRKELHPIRMDVILPLALRGCLKKDVSKPLIELSNFFYKLTSRSLNVEVLEQLERNIAIILCKLEKIFPLTFFNVMVHLTMHLASEAIRAGPVQFQWMYPFERYDTSKIICSIIVLYL